MFALLDWLLGRVLRSQLLYFSHKCSNIGNVPEVEQHVSSGDYGFYSKPYFAGLRIYRRNKNTQGYAESNGLLFAEQNNERLQKSDNRFYLEGINSKMGDKKVFTRWFTENLYDLNRMNIKHPKRKII